METLLEQINKLVHVRVPTSPTVDLFEKLVTHRFHEQYDDEWLVRSTSYMGSLARTTKRRVATEAEAISFHSVRAVQTLRAVVAGLIGDEVDITPLSFWESVRCLRETYMLYFLMDLAGTLLKFVKNRSVGLSARMFHQSESNTDDRVSCDEKFLGIVNDMCVDFWDESSSKGDPELNIDPFASNFIRLFEYLHVCVDKDRFSVVQADRPGALALGFGSIAKWCRSHWAPRPWTLARSYDQFRRAQNVAYIKRGMPVTPQWEIDTTVLKHRTALGTSRYKAPTDLSEAIERDEQRSRVLSWIDLIVHEVFKNQVLSEKEPVPSTHACFERGMTKGGAIVELVEDPFSADADPANRPPLDNQSFGHLDYMVEVTPGETFTIRRSLTSELAIRRFTETVKARCELHRESRPVWNGSVRESSSYSAPVASPIHKYRVDVLPAAVCEPCKIRMITMGNAAPYQRALVLQGFMWRAVKKDLHFQWTGKPITSADWEEANPCVEIYSLLHEPGSLYELVSGDFSAATDNLDPAISEYTWRAICDEVWTLSDEFVACDMPLSDEEWSSHLFEPISDAELAANPRRVAVPLSSTRWYDIGLACLTGHFLHHGEKREKAESLPGSPQQWGQLMGSPMSFPILNIANAAAACAVLGPQPPIDPATGRWLPRTGTYLISSDPEIVGSCSAMWAEWRRSAIDFWRTNPCYLHTNGDDIKFVSPSPATTERWSQSAASVGLNKSPGKNLTSKFFWQMNSELRGFVPTQGPATADGQAPHCAWGFIPFLNLPILFGEGVKGSMAGKSILSITPYYTVGPFARQLVRDCTEELSVHRLTMWRQFWQPLLARVPPGVIWECPEALGGLGVPPYSGHEPPEESLLRCAWLTRLGPMNRAKAVNPPQPKTRVPWLRSLRQAMQAGIQVDRLEEPTDDWFALNSRLSGDRGGQGAVLGEFLKNFWYSFGTESDKDLSQAALDLGVAWSDRGYLTGRYPCCRPPPAWANFQRESYIASEVLRNEAAYTRRIWKQNVAAKAAGKKPGYNPDIDYDCRIGPDWPSYKELTEGGVSRPQWTRESARAWVLDFTPNEEPFLLGESKSHSRYLHPMRSDHLTSWSDRRVLVSRRYQPSYQDLIDL